MSRLILSLLGPIQFMLEGKPISGFKSDKVRALLAYLAVEAQRPHRREALAGLLWPELPDRDATSNLRYALYNLRKSLKDSQMEPPFLLVTREDLQFNQASDHWLDVALFAQLASVKVSNASGSHHLWEAVDLYRGAFLEGFSIDECAAFEEWILLKREMFGRKLYTVLQWLAEHHGQRGEYELAELAIRSQLQIEPWDEIAHRRLMGLLAHHGQRAAALAQYEACRFLLAEELSVEPSPETTQLYEQIRQGQLSQGEVRPSRHSNLPREEQRATLLPAPVNGPPVVSREREIAQLYGYLQTTLAGQGKVVFIKGDPGSGKTVLLEAFGRSVIQLHPELLVAAGNCRAYGGTGVPFLPFRQLLEDFIGNAESRQSGVDLGSEPARRMKAARPMMRQTLSTTDPDFFDQLLVGASLQPRANATLAGDDARNRPWPFQTGWGAKTDPTENRGEGLAQSVLFEQVTQILGSLASHYPLLLLIDDLQWVDSGSASMLFHIGRRLGNTQILILGAYRPGDVADGPSVAVTGTDYRHPLSAIINEFQRDFGHIVVDLDRSNCRGFVNALVDTEPNRLDTAFRETLYHHTGGQALFTVELLRDLEQRGDLVQDETGRWVVGPSLDWGRLPSRVEAVIAERIDRLPADARLLLATASVQGQEFVAEVVARVQAADAYYVARQLSGPLSKGHRLVRARGVQHLGNHRLSHYSFRHFLFQQYIYQQLDQVERALLHEATGQALEELYADQRGEHAAELARHFEVAGVVEKAVDYLSQAGKRAYLLSANEEAIAYFRRGLKLTAAELPGPEQCRRELKLQMALSAPLRAAKGYAAPAVGKVYARIYELAQLIGDPVQLFQSRFLLWSYYLSQADYQEAIDLAMRLRHHAEQDQQALLLAQANLALGAVRLYLGEFREARTSLEATVSSHETSAQSYLISPVGGDMRVAALICLTRTIWFLGYPDQALKRSDEVQAQAKDLNHAHSQALALAMGGCMIHLLRRDYREAETQAEALLQLSVERGLAFYEAWAKVFQGRGQVERGRFTKGLANMREGIAGCRSAGHKSNLTMLTALMAEAYGSAEQPERALRWLEESLSLLQESGERLYEAEIHRLKGEFLLQKGADPLVAEASFRRAILVAQRQEAKSLELRAVTSLAQLWQTQGKLEQTIGMLQEVYGWFTEGLDTGDLIETRALLARLREGALQNEIVIDR